MRLRIALGCVLSLLALVAASPALAQTGFEIELGANYPLIGSDLEIAQDPAYHARIAYNFSPRWQVGVVYDILETEGDIRPLKFQFVDSVRSFDDFTFETVDVPVRDNLTSGGKADLTLYGITGALVLVGEPRMQILLIGSVGQGKLEFDNPVDEIPAIAREDLNGNFVRDDGVYGPEDYFISGREDETDIKLWWEIGPAVRFNVGDRWAFRVSTTYRRIEPDGVNTVLPVGATEIVPQAGAIFRF